MPTVTLHDGTIADVTLANVDSLVRQQLDSLRADFGSAAVDGSDGVGAGTQEAFYALVGKPYDTAARAAATATSALVTNNPVVQAADAAFHSVPAEYQTVWKNTSDATIQAGSDAIDKVKQAAKAIGDNLPDWLQRLLDLLKNLESAGLTVVVVGGVVVVAGVGAYLVFKFKK